MKAEKLYQIHFWNSVTDSTKMRRQGRKWEVTILLICKASWGTPHKGVLAFKRPDFKRRE